MQQTTTSLGTRPAMAELAAMGRSGVGAQRDRGLMVSCVAPAAEGFGCDGNASVNCLAPARCVSNDGQPTDGGPVVGKCEMSSGVACQ
jgi:hypothetical protein